MSFRIGFVSSSGNPATALDVQSLLPPDTQLDVMSIDEATQQVAEGAVVLLILAMDGADWRADLRFIDNLHLVGEKRPLAVLALVPGADPEALAIAFEYNVADVAGLPVNPHELRPRLAALVRRRMVALSRLAETRAVLQLATIDPVTGLHNRHHLRSVLPAAIDSARRARSAMSFLMIDLDGFKPYNDRWGHAAGDYVLHCVASTLKSHVRPGDTVARYGGDEIAVVLPGADGLLAHAMATTLLAAVEKACCETANAPMSMTISIGVATLKADDSSESLINRADTALYAAKASGRNRVSAAA